MAFAPLQLLNWYVRLLKVCIITIFVVVVAVVVTEPYSPTEALNESTLGHILDRIE